MAGRSVGSSWGSRVPWRLAPAVAGVVSLGSMARMVLTTSRFVTNGDGAHVWYAAHEWGQGRWHEPAFYGQSYGSNALGVPIAALHALGVPYPTATPAVMTLSILLLWLPLAAAFQRRGHLAVATVTAALPALTATYYEFYVASVPYERLFGATGIGVALLIATRRSRIALGFGAALAGIGVAADTSALILVLPVGAWWVLEREHPRAEWWSVAAGGSVAAAYGIGTWWFYRIHPDDNLHGGLPLAPSWSRLTASLSDPVPRFGLFAPELLRGAWIPIVISVVVVGVLLTRRRARYVVPAALVLGLTLLALSTPRALDDAGRFLPPARALLSLPPAICFLGFLLADSLRPRAWVAAAGRWLITGVAVLLAVTVAVRVTVDDHGTEVVLNQSLGSTYGYSYVRVASVERRCRELADEASRSHVDLLVLPTQGIVSGACVPLTGADLTIIDAPFDRRTWLLRDIATRRRTGMLVGGVPPGFCHVADARFRSCTRIGPDAVVRFSRRPAMDVLAQLDIPVRAFGPGCVPSDLRCRSGRDTRERFPVRRGRPTATERAELQRALDRFVRDGDAEPGAPPDGESGRLRRALAAARITASDWFVTGPDTAAATLRVQGPGRTTTLLGQTVRVHGRQYLAATTRCAVATALGVRCTSPVPGFLPVSWR